ncbi:MAG TPA: isocitrate lyase/phosphoenolpyruvate mutase family protein [Polyangiaceae bacterium]
MTSIDARRDVFRRLHESGCFVAPNPWDRGSAVILERLGFRALASSSAGFAFSRGLTDSALALDRAAVLDHLRDLVAATTVPVNADYQAGYGDDPRAVAESVRLCVETGIGGLSIEDATGDVAAPLFPLDVAVARLRAAREAIDASPGSGRHVVLTARAECHLVGHPDPLPESIARLRAYAAAGADVLFAPGLRDAESMRAVIEAVAPKPVNVLVGASLGLRVSDVAALGARRISVGSAFARVAWSAFLASAKEVLASGDFGSFDGLPSTHEMSRWFE